MNESQKKITNQFEIAIVGASFSGCLAALRLASTHPHTKIAVIEKENSLCGRKRFTRWAEKIWSVGNLNISDELFEFSKNILRSLGQDHALESTDKSSLETKVGVISQGKLAIFNREKILSQEFIKFLGGKEAVPRWTDIWGKIDTQKELKSLSKILTFPKKGPFALVVDVIGRYLGFVDVSQVPTLAIKQAYDHCRAMQHLLDWEEVFSLAFRNQDNIEQRLECKVISGQYHDNFWRLQTQKGPINAKRIVISHSPWDVIEWLDKESLPPVLVQSVKRKNPASLVVLSTKIVGDWMGPNTLFIASEGVHVTMAYGVSNFTVPIDYESSMRAPSVVKAIRKLRRAVKKLTKVFDKISFEQEHIALSTVGVNYSTLLSEPLVSSEEKKLNQPHIGFCGSFYGSSFDPQKNILSSVLNLDLWAKNSKVP